MKSKIAIVLMLLAAYCLPPDAAGQTRDFTRWVNPFIGTGGHGHTFPGATMPFGMVQLSPDTRIDNWDGSSGYHYSDDIIYGFSHTHLSGTGIPDGCDILFMPTVGEPQFFANDGDKSANGYASRFSHANEKAEPGYYSVKLQDDGILAELTATKRVGFHRYTFPTGEKANVILDLKWRDKLLDSDAKILGKRVEGFRRSSSWAKDQTTYFVAEFSRAPLESKQEIENVSGPGGSRSVTSALTFNLRREEKLMIKVAISYVSIEGARKNLEAELPHWNFEKVRAEAKAAWNKELSKIGVSGGTDEQTTNFYTALYHTMIQPNVFNDVDGKYRGHDGKVHELGRGDGATQRRGDSAAAKSPRPGVSPSPRHEEHYSVFSLWDTFRATHPLYTIIDQRRTVDFINTFIRQYEQGGRLPVWELWGEETDTMIGYHAVSVIADAMAKGIKGFDYEKAYKAAKHSAELDHFGLAAYKKRGYISMEDENESVSKTLEYAYNDWCIAQMARLLMSQKMLDWAGSSSDGNPRKPPADMDSLQKDFETYSRRARHFENLYDRKTGFFRPKKNGGFVEPFAPNEVTFGFTEGNSWQYSFFVPHDVRRLEELMGGRAKFTAKLDELFTTDQKLGGREQADLTGLIGQYAHGNEPSHHIVYLYNYVGRPSRTQKYVRKIMDEFYKNAPDGLIGNEDCGQMSAWYVMSASGFYPVAPGRAAYEIGTPLFPEMKYKLENGKSFTIKAPGVSSRNFYVKGVKLNGVPVTKAYIEHSDVAKGGVLEFEMTDTPTDTAFRTFGSNINPVVQTVAVPVIDGGGLTFKGSTVVSISTLTPRANIYYALGDGDFAVTAKRYTAPFAIDSTTTISAEAVNEDSVRSHRVDARFIKRPNDWTVKIISPYSTQYTGGGDNAIVDGIRGTTNFASGEWQGVQGKAYEAVIDLQRETEIREVGGSFLQVARPWIWMPDRVEFEVSSDGVKFTRVAEMKPSFPQREMTPTIREYVEKITPVRARYVRVRAFNFGKIPSWHLGAGGDPWIFVDEIFIR